MSFNNQLIKFYPNWLNYNTSDIDGINYDPEAEPSITGEGYTNSDGTTSGPAYDLIDNKIGSVVTLDTDSQASSPTIQFDLTGSIKFDTVILANNNFGDVVVDVEFDVGIAGTVTFSTCNSTSVTIKRPRGYYILDNPVSVSSDAASFAASEDGIALFELDGETGEVQFQVDFSAIAPYSDDMILGEVVASLKWEAPHAPEVSGWFNVDKYGNVINRTPGGQNYGTLNHGLKKRITLPFKNLSSVQEELLAEVFQVTKGSTYPMFVDLGEHATQHYLRYMRLVGEYSSIPIAGGTYHNATITLEEE